MPELQTLFPLGWQHYLVGGLLVGAGVSLLFVLTGQIGGASTVFSSSWSWVSSHPFFQQPRFTGTRGWRAFYAAGLVVGAFVWAATLGPDGGVTTAIPAWQLLAGGFLAGFGARMSNGCTSGHGICGLASLQMPSLLAVLTFLATAMLVAHGTGALAGGAR